MVEDSSTVADTPSPASTPAAPAGTPRLENTTACLPIVSGSVAFYLGKKADEYQTHQWTLYLRGPRNEDLSLAVSKVVFQLHPSFAQPTRELTEPPYEVTERGWGEFEAQIRIFYKDPSEQNTLVRGCETAPCSVFRAFISFCEMTDFVTQKLSSFTCFASCS